MLAKAVYLCIFQALNDYNMKTQSLISLFKDHNGYLTKEQLSKRALYDKLRKMIEDGKVERVKNGLYFMQEASDHPEQIDISLLVPQGVLCLYSCWFHYELSVQVPQAYHIAIEKSRKVTLPEYPPVKLHYWQKEYLDMGVVKVKIAGYLVDAYDIEKSVCDAVKFRNKIGMETMSEILKNYLKRKERNLTRLMDYAKKMRMANILKTFLEVQL